MRAETRTVVTFKSAAFNTTEPKDYFVNPGCFGDDVAAWLIGELHNQGVQTDDKPGQEDFGWYLNFQVAGTYHTFVIGHRPGNQPGDGEWIAWLERSRDLIGSVTGGRRRGIKPSAAETLHKILSTSPQITDLRWHFRGDFDKGEEERGAATPSEPSTPSETRPAKKPIVQINLLKKTALIAAIALTLVHVQWVIDFIRFVAATPPFRWTDALQIVIYSLFALPLPLLLAVLYWTGARLTVSRDLRYLALITAVIQGVFFTAPGLYAWIRNLWVDLENARLFGEATIGANLWAWFRPDAGVMIGNAITALSHMAFFLFLVALFLKAGGSPEAGARPRRLLRKIARLATIMGVLAVLLGISELMYRAIRLRHLRNETRWSRTVVRGQFILNHALFVLVYVPWAVAPWIIYKSTPRVSNETTAES